MVHCLPAMINCTCFIGNDYVIIQLSSIFIQHLSTKDYFSRAILVFRGFQFFLFNTTKSSSRTESRIPCQNATTWGERSHGPSQPSISQTSNYSPVDLGYVARENPYHSPLIAALLQFFFGKICVKFLRFLDIFWLLPIQNIAESTHIFSSKNQMEFISRKGQPVATQIHTG